MTRAWLTLTPVPAHDLVPLMSGEWRSTGTDPQFALHLPEGTSLGEGWTTLEVEIDFPDTSRRPRLYWDDGEGFNERNWQLLPAPMSGHSTGFLFFAVAPKALRLDPCDCETAFSLRGIRLRRESRATLAVSILLPYVGRALRNPRLYARIARDFSTLLVRRGPTAVRGAIRELVTTRNGTAVLAYIAAQLRSPGSAGNVSAASAARITANRIGMGWEKSHKLRIGIGLVEHLGDIVACEPVARYLRKKHPDAEITWVVRDAYRELIDQNPNIDHTVAVDCLTDWIKWSSHSAFDQVIDLHVNERICQHCRIPLQKKAGDLSITGDNYFDHGGLLRAFCLSAGLPPLEDEPRVYIPQSAVEAVDKLELPEDYVVFHCRSNSLEKDWDASKWTELARRISFGAKTKIVEVGLDAALPHLGSDVVHLTGQLSLLETAEVIRRARAFLGVDSGPAHLANAVKTTGVILMGQLANFRTYNPFSGDYGQGRNVRLVRNERGQASELAVDAVEQALLEAMGRRSAVECTATAPDVGEPATTARSDSAPPRVIAFYLPQFHPIPENDRAWGKGFTEWRNVGKSRPFFDGQYQPRLPGELGYYDLRVPEIMDQQADLAREHGIDAFCYYYYWFNGRRLLHLPLDNLLQRRKPNFPFCFCWANENWTRRWDGHEKEILVAQHHNPKDDVDFIRFIMPALDDPRYLRVNGRPLLLVYRTELFPDPAATAERWRNETIKAGIGDLFLVRCEGFDIATSPDSIGFDAAYEVPTFILPDELKVRDPRSLNPSPEWRGRIYDYQKIIDYYLSRETPPYKRFHGPMLGWDNTPRHGNRAVVFHEVTGEKFGRWLAGALAKTRKTFIGEERLTFINAWNEWAEGSYLEPDLKYGRQFLEAAKRAVEAQTRGARSSVEAPATAVPEPAKETLRAAAA